MKPERWEQIDQILDAVLECEPAERAAFLDQACAGDEALRRKVEALLVAYGKAESFIEAPAFEVAAQALAANRGELLGARPPDDLAAEPLAEPLSGQPARSSAPGATECGVKPTPAKPARDHQRKPLFFWLACVLGTVIFGFYVFTGVMTYRYETRTASLGWQSLSQAGGHWQISAISAQSEAADKLQVGDQILAFNDLAWSGKLPPGFFFMGYPRLTTYTMRVARGSVEHQFTLPITRRPSYSSLWQAIPQLIIGLGFWAIALLIGLAKPQDRLARLACLLLFAFAIVFLNNALIPISQSLQGWERIVLFPVLAFIGLPMALAYHFFYRFPSGIRPGRFWTVLTYLLYGGGLIATLMKGWFHWGYLPGGRALINFYTNYSQQISWSFRFPRYIQVAASLAIIAVIIRNYRLTTERDQRRRIKWVAFSTVVALLFFALVETAVALGYVVGSINMMNAASTLPTILVPVSFGFAILKHRLLDITVVVRRGLQYLLAKNSLRVILALPLLGLAYSIIANPDRTVREILFQNPLALALTLSAALSLPFRQRLSLWIDRRFFREAYDQEQLLLGLIEEIKESRELSEIARLVSQKVEAALHPRCLYVFYREEHTRDLMLGYSSGGHARNLSIAESARLLRLMEGQSSAQEYSSLASAGLPADEHAMLDDLQIQLLVPMNGSDGQLVGLLLFGEKKSEQPYTATDRRLLFALAQQMAIVYEIVWLKGRVDKGEQIKRDVLSRLEGQQVNLLKECPACGVCYDAADQVCKQEGSALTLTLPVERQIDGKYRLEQLLGKGGMGAVYEATDARLERRVAIKIITGRLFGDSAALRRFEREARASARLNHPNIITVYDYGAIGAEGAYLVMELIRGVTLRAELKQAGTIAPAVAAEYFDQLLEGMKAAHASGVIHRDLKLENVLIARQQGGHPLVKILDFGLAKLRLLNTTDPNSLTAPGTVMGTFGYMSPEQLTGGEVDERSDIFALGVMVVEALTGSRPFGGKSYTELLTTVLRQPFHLTGEAQAVQRLDAVLQKCLAKERQQRYETVAELQAELILAIRHCPPLAAASLASRDGERANLPTS